MKVYSISRWAFYAISLLILALPVSRNWKLLVKGKKANGTVIAYTRQFQEHLGGDITIEYASEIHFQTKDSLGKAYGPMNLEYEPGRNVTVMYNPEDPSLNCILTFSGFYLNSYAVIPIFLLVVWYAFYLSFNNYSKRTKKNRTTGSADSSNMPYRKKRASPMKLRTLMLLLILVPLTSCKFGEGTKSSDGTARLISMKKPMLETLQLLDSALITLQVQHPDDPDFGALWCPHCELYHTRAAEALYPFAYQYIVKGDTLFRNASIVLGNWLIEQQEDNGSWKETPEEWTGTSTDQLLMMALTYPMLLEDLSDPERIRWLDAMRKAGNYLVDVMEPKFASINYVATTAASMAVLNQVIPDPAFSRKATTMAESVVAKMDEDHFITGEGGRVLGIKYGVDLGYNLEMSLWGLALYARLTEDHVVLEKVKRSLERHLHFIYPDGSMDGSWGIRSNKWTGYGGATSDGCQLLFSMLADEDPAYRTAALRNLEYLKKCMKEGFVGYGPHHWDVLPYPPCIYPTFAKAKNMAMAHAFCVQDTGPEASLPSDQMGLDVFSTLDIALVRTEFFHATVTNYGYKDPRGPASKYMHRPAGGAISNLWLKDYGFLQASSQTEYHRWEPMSFPEASNLRCLTPRIEFSDSRGNFTNLYEFDASSLYREWEDSIAVSIFGELKNRTQQEGGIGYSYQYIFKDNSVGKRVGLRFHDATEQVHIIEPIIINPGTIVEQVDEHTVMITKDELQVHMRLMEGNASISVGNEKENYWSVYPALKGYPVTLSIKPDRNHSEAEIYYEFRVLR